MDYQPYLDHLAKNYRGKDATGQTVRHVQLDTNRASFIKAGPYYCEVCMTTSDRGPHRKMVHLVVILNHWVYTEIAVCYDLEACSYRLAVRTEP